MPRLHFKNINFGKLEIKECVYELGKDVEPMTEFNSVYLHNTCKHTDLAGLLNYSVQIRGFAGIGYHFAIDPRGAIYATRPLRLQGAHVLGRNQKSVGIVMLDINSCAVSSAAKESFLALYQELQARSSPQPLSLFSHTQGQLSYLREKIEQYNQLVEREKGKEEEKAASEKKDITTDKIREVNYSVSDYPVCCEDVFFQKWEQIRRQFAESLQRLPEQKSWSASTIKVPVMISVVKALEAGKLSLDDKLRVNHRFTLEKYDPVSRMLNNTPISVLNLLMYMIIVSDNEATNMLAAEVGLEEINQHAVELGAKSTMMAHLLVSCQQYGEKVPRLTAEWNKEGSNLTSACDLTTLMAAIYQNRAASPPYCRLMRELLEARGAQGLLGRCLPRYAKVGGKLGYLSDSLQGDDYCETIVVNGSYALSVMCNRIPPCKIASKDNSAVSPITPMLPIISISPSKFMSLISRTIYNAYY